LEVNDSFMDATTTFNSGEGAENEVEVEIEVDVTES
jgi:hypothetical protein